MEEQIESIKKEYNQIKSTKTELKDFSLVVGTVLVVIGYVKQFDVVLVAGVVLLICGVFFPKILTPFHKIWMLLAVLLNKIMTTLILFVIFIGVLIPTGFLMRFIFRKDILLSIDESKTYWHNRKRIKKTIKDYQSQF